MPVGLVTGDELALGGNVYTGDYNQKSYLFKGSWYWSLSAYYLHSTGGSYVLGLGSYINATYVSLSTGGIAPVINLKSEVVQNFTGKGTMTEPFEIQ